MKIKSFDTTQMNYYNPGPIEFGGGMNVFIGANGVGKTWLLENIQSRIVNAPRTQRFNQNCDKASPTIEEFLDEAYDALDFISSSYGKGVEYVRSIVRILASPIYGARCAVFPNFADCLGPREARSFSSLIQEWCTKYDRQVICSTHTPGVLDGLDLADDANRLFAINWIGFDNLDDPHTRARNSAGRRVCRRLTPSPELLAMNATHPFSRLWPMGNLGGVPNI